VERGIGRFVVSVGRKPGESLCLEGFSLEAYLPPTEERQNTEKNAANLEFTEFFASFSRLPDRRRIGNQRDPVVHQLKLRVEAAIRVGVELRCRTGGARVSRGDSI
jgi:hypothetical protein